MVTGIVLNEDDFKTLKPEVRADLLHKIAALRDIDDDLDDGDRNWLDKLERVLQTERYLFPKQRKVITDLHRKYFCDS